MRGMTRPGKSSNRLRMPQNRVAEVAAKSDRMESGAVVRSATSATNRLHARTKPGRLGPVQFHSRPPLPGGRVGSSDSAPEYTPPGFCYTIGISA
jgi:hypothetical protein